MWLNIFGKNVKLDSVTFWEMPQDFHISISGRLPNLLKLPECRASFPSVFPGTACCADINNFSSSSGPRSSSWLKTIFCLRVFSSCMIEGLVLVLPTKARWVFFFSLWYDCECILVIIRIFQNVLRTDLLPRNFSEENFKKWCIVIY